MEHLNLATASSLPNTKNVYIGFVKRLFSAILSTFDIVSDLVNSCDFLGYDASGQITSSIHGEDSNISETS